MPKEKHLTLDEHQAIQLDLNENLSFKQIVENIGKDHSTVSKEVRNHITMKLTGSFNPCTNFKECTHYSDLCLPCNNRYGGHRNCNHLECFSRCKDFIPKYCKKLISPPYVCNNCQNRRGCHLDRHLYDAI